MLIDEIRRGLIIRNPIFVAAVGLCPALAVSTTVRAGLDLGIALTIVLLIVNTLVSITRHIVSERSRLPVVLSFAALAVAVLSILARAFAPSVEKELGIFLPLIAVNCLVLERADAFARHNRIPKALIDALVIGLGYTAALVVLSGFREIVGFGTFLGFGPIPHYKPISVFASAPGGFFALAGIAAAISALVAVRRKAAENG